MTQSTPPLAQTILVLGGYGLIGAALCRHLHGAGHRVIVAGRSADMAQKTLPHLPFRLCDLHQMTGPQAWEPLLKDVDCVLNCAGALQDTGGSDLEQIHHHALAALAPVAKSQNIRAIQISAAGAHPDASTAFMASKARGDAAMLAAGGACTILRPGLVLAQSAYGGTTLLRMLAAMPLIQPVALGDAPIQSIGLPDLAHAVDRALSDDLPGGPYDLVEDATHSLIDTLAAHRAALGFAPARAHLHWPDALLPPVTAMADALAHLGWRSPLRRTAVQVLAQGVTGNPTAYRATGGHVAPMQDTLAALHLGPEHRLAARAALVMPICVALLALFWMLSGVIGLIRIAPAATHLTAIGWPSALALASVAFWAAVDMALSALILWRPMARRACLGMIAVSAIYLASATLFTPWMWADPLGPLVKVLPSMGLALVTLILLEER